jgi:hypothetical protein
MKNVARDRERVARGAGVERIDMGWEGETESG